MQLKTIQAITLNNEIHYWLNTDFTHFDGTEFIMNEQCDTVCFFCGECFQPECANDYDFEDWEIIWQP